MKLFLSSSFTLIFIVYNCLLLLSWCSISTVVNAFQPVLSVSKVANTNRNHHGRQVAFLNKIYAFENSNKNMLYANNNEKDMRLENAIPQQDLNKSTVEKSENATTLRQQSIVEECYNAWNGNDMDKAVSFFADDTKLEYEDSQYIGKFTTKQELKRSFQQRKAILPPNTKVVVDHVATCTRTGNIGTQYHVEYTTNKKILPFTRGCAFYTTTTRATSNDGDQNNFKITSCFRVLEMFIKPGEEFANQLVASVSKFTKPSSSSKTNIATTSSSTTDTTTTRSIIEEYFEAWNERDFEKALSFFEDDCLYETEDPVFVGVLNGKDELRQHLIKNADALPSSCQIILDGIAVDTQGNGNIATKWHLEVNGIPIPNLRGCSMYTTNLSSGLLQTGYDVTEAPIKVPKVTLPLLSVPAKFVFGLAPFLPQ